MPFFYLMRMIKQIITLLLVIGACAPLTAQSGYTPTEENLKARREFQDNKFGIFLHWGLFFFFFFFK